MFDLHNKVALVTGASRGIGRAIALTLAQRGATVIGTATTEQGAAMITDALQAKGFRGEGKVLEVTDANSITRLFSSIQAPDILVNNAGITRDNLLLRMKDEEWQKVIDTNLTAVYHLTKLCIKTMLKNRWGRIINISSVSGTMGNPGQVNYAAAKAGLIGFAKALAYEVATRNITVNVVAPGFIDTDMTRDLSDEQKQWIMNKVPTQRFGSAEEVAAAVVFLASQEAAYITGQTLQVNGGMYMV
jgi:3-oxoacyl-[acyl-carrier protein] reductase